MSCLLRIAHKTTNSCSQSMVLSDYFSIVLVCLYGGVVFNRMVLGLVTHAIHLGIVLNQLYEWITKEK